MTDLYLNQTTEQLQSLKTAVEAGVVQDHPEDVVEVVGDPTGKPTDLAIEGDGFFVVQGKEQKFTRDGSFVLNQANQLVTSGGDFVQGFAADANGNVVNGTLSNIQVPLGALTKAARLPGRSPGHARRDLVSAGGTDAKATVGRPFGLVPHPKSHALAATLTRASE